MNASDGTGTVMLVGWGALAIYVIAMALFMWFRRRRKIDSPKAVLMPADCLSKEREPRLLRDIPIGETVYTDFTNVCVNERGAVFIGLDEWRKETARPRFAAVELRRERDGWVLTLSGREEVTFKPVPLLARTRKQYEPVIRVEAPTAVETKAAL